MSTKMTDRQRQLVAAAAQRKDRLLIIPPNLKGAAVAKVAAALIAGGMAEEIKAKAGAPVWRHEAGSDQSYALKLTAAGVKAIAAEGRAIADVAGGLNHRETPRRVPSVRTRAEASTDSEATTQSQPRGDEITLALRAPPAGSKLDRIIGLLSSSEGATIDDLMRTTNWLPHTARAALTGLRKRGYEVRLDRGTRDRPSIYHIGASLSPEATK